MITNTKQVFEIIELFEQSTNKSGRLAVLKEYSDCIALKDLLRGMFDDKLVFSLPEGRPPYTANIPESVPSSLLKEHKQFGYFVKGAKGDSLPDYKRENMFIGLLESIHPADSELVLSMVAKKSPVKFLTKKLVQEAFPKLITT